MNGFTISGLVAAIVLIYVPQSMNGSLTTDRWFSILKTRKLLERSSALLNGAAGNIK